MKKIDLHIHTKPGKSDAQFIFSMDTLKKYVDCRKIDCIAITNHNLFDFKQFLEIKNELNIEVLPGIEIDLEKGHILVIADYDDVCDFKNECDIIEKCINTQDDYVTLEQFRNIFKRIGRYLLIPHYLKSPELKSEHIECLGSYIRCGEVKSEKKFFQCLKDPNTLVPVLFSDERMSVDKDFFSLRQTFIDSIDLKVSDIKICLSDKNKVSLNPQEGNELFQILDNGFCASTGLNVILGERSSGKTFTLNRINSLFRNVKYIHQFALIEKDGKKEEQLFKEKINTKKSSVFENYLSEFKSVVDDINEIDRDDNIRTLDSYLVSLKKYAIDYEKRDSFSKSVIFSESEFDLKDENSLIKLIDATKLIFENVEYKEMIDSFVNRESLKSLLLALINKYKEEKLENCKKRIVNKIISLAKDELNLKTNIVSPSNCSFKKVLIDEKKIKNFNKIANSIKKYREIAREDLYRFKVIASTEKLGNATAIGKQYGKQASFTNAYGYYDDPYQYIIKLKEIQSVPETEFYKLFIKLSYKVFNEYNAEISGGERSEFNLLIELSDARKYEMLLIDEPESSFDNLFLKSNVNKLIKDISNEIPVFVATHNSTIGESIKPDYIIHTRREINDSKVFYKLYGGYPSSKLLSSIDGKTIENYTIVMNCLEGGEDTYLERNKTYEILRNKR